MVDNLTYPNSRIVTKAENRLELESVDGPEVVTLWYKEKIKEQRFSIQSFVATRSNGNVLNKLVGIEGEGRISVEISKDLVNEVVEITIKTNN